MAGQGNAPQAPPKPSVEKEIAERTIAALLEERKGYELKLGAAQNAAEDEDEEAVKLFGSPGKWARRINAVAESLAFHGYKGDEAKKIEVPKKAEPAPAPAK